MKNLYRFLAASAIALVTLVSVLSFTGTQKVPLVYAASSDYLLTLDGVQDTIEVNSFSWGVSTPRDSASGQATGKRQYQPVIIRKRIDKASPLLFRAIDTGKNFKTATLIVSGSDGQVPFTLVLTNVMISSFQQQGDSGTPPMESVSFTFQKIEMK